MPSSRFAFIAKQERRPEPLAQEGLARRQSWGRTMEKSQRIDAARITQRDLQPDQF
jgi:hypothetical protein